MTPRVLVLTADYPPCPWSGIGVAVERQARALAAQGADVHVLVAGDRPLPVSPVPGRPAVHRLSRRRFPLDPRGFDWVHVHSLRLAGLALELRRRFPLRLACTHHGSPDQELPAGPEAERWSAVERRLLEGSDRIVFLSRAERARVLARDPHLEGRDRLVPHGLHPARERPREDRTAGPIVFAGRFARTKGIDLAVEVARRLAPRHRFVFAGGHGDRWGMAALDSLPGTCRRAGWLDRRALDRLLARAALVLAPSRYEPFGLVPLEALRAGAPVLAADAGGLADTVAPGSGSRRLATRHPDDWAQAALDLLADPGSARRGPAWVAERFDAARSARRLLQDVYDSGPIPPCS